MPSEGAKGKAETSSPALEASVGRLGRLTPGADLDEAVAALVRQGEAAVAEIGLQLAERDPDYGWRHTAVRVLRGVNSEKSRTVLRRMALGEVGQRDPGLEDWAARALIACDRREAWTLLASATPQVLTSSLNSVDGQAVDEKHMPLLKKCLAHEADLVRWRAADVLADDPTGKRTGETLQAVAQALEAIPRLPNVNAPHRQMPPTGWTIGEACYQRYVNVLVRVKADNEALRALAKRVEGRARDAVLLALARRGDKTVHDDLLKLAQDPKADLFRAWAVSALREIGTPEDVPLLRTLAKTDPLVREGPSGPGGDSTRPTYPVRQAAEEVIRALEKKSRQAEKRTP